MRTNIDIDDELMEQAMKATGATTKRAAVEAAMQLAVRLQRQGEALRRLRGKIVWRGHDDDWFASDKEILAQRRANEKPATTPKHRRTA
jgi:Arc/MetJ family transcription regulator